MGENDQGMSAQKQYIHRVLCHGKFGQDNTRAGTGLKSAGSGQAWAFHCGLGLLRDWPGLGVGSGSGLRA
jgi:hypothetical protein